MKTSIVYLLHFERPIGNPASPFGTAQHYLGSSTDLDAELARLRGPNCHAAIMRELCRQGVDWWLVRTWPGSRVDERRRKGRSARPLCPECSPVYGYQRGVVMVGGYSDIAKVINERFAPQPPIDRRQVASWYKRGTWNQARKPPPQPVRELASPKRTKPRYLFDTDAWAAWFAAGVPGPRGQGWRVWVEKDLAS